MLRTLLATTMLVLLAVNSHALVGQSGFWLTGTGAYAVGKSEQSGKLIDGAALALTLEGMRGDNMSFGLSLAYAVMDGQENEAGVPVKRRVSSMPGSSIASSSSERHVL